MSRQVKIVVSGRVQGVYFRAFTRNKAKRLGISGSATNLADGRVEIIAQGEPAVIELFINWCRKGPITARVDRCDVDEMSVGEVLNTFEVR